MLNTNYHCCNNTKANALQLRQCTKYTKCKLYGLYLILMNVAIIDDGQSIRNAHNVRNIKDTNHNNRYYMVDIEC